MVVGRDKTITIMTGYNVKTVKELVYEQEQRKSVLRKLFGNLWLEGELCFLFGDSNAGKTLLANDIAIANSGGECYWPEEFHPSSNQKVAVLEFELNERQFAGRYLGSSNILPDGFIRIGFNLSEYNTEVDMFQSAVMMMKQMQAQADAPKVFILDNLTFLMDATSMKHSIETMKQLKVLKDKYGLSILIIGHCPKRKKSAPITQDDLGGSKMLMNFADSAFAIADSIWGPATKYVKHLKSRSVPREEGVLVAEIDTAPYLHFSYVERTEEDEHIKKSAVKSTSSITPELEAQILDLKDLGLSIREIANELNLSKSAVGRFVKAAGI